MFDRLKTVGFVTLAATIAVVIASVEALSLAVGWLLAVYVLVRAWPGVRADVIRARERWFPKTAWRF